MSYSLKGPTTLDIGEQLRQEEQWLNTLTESLERSQQLKEGMISILDSFEKRLSNLESTVLPMYEHTGLLQQRQLNISKTLKAIDSTLSYYTTASELDSTLRDTDPSEDLDKYLKHMTKLKEAIKFFSVDKSHGNQVENVKSTFEFGCSALEREFKENIRKNTTAVKAQIILDVISDDYEVVPAKLQKVDLMPLKSVEILSKVAQWLIANGTSTDFMNFYGENRGLVVQKVLLGIQDSLKSSAAAAAPSSKTQASPLMPRRETGGKSIGLAAKKISRQYVTDQTSRRTTTLAPEQVTKESSMENDAEAFVLLTSSLIALATLENELMQRIFGLQQKDLIAKLMHNLVERPTQLVFVHEENLLTHIQRSLNKQDHAAMLCLFPVSKYFHTNERRFDIILKHCSHDLKHKFLQFTKFIDNLCITGLDAFVEHVKSDQDKFVPKDGTVHQLTSNALIFLEQLMNVRDCLAVVLAGGSIERSHTEGVVPKYFARVLSALGLNLRNKAELYTDSALKAIFMLNNYNHILKSLLKTGVMKIVCEQNREVENYYYEQIKEYKKQYLQCWNRLLAVFNDYQRLPQASPSLGHRFKDKERDQLKSTFADFNKEFENLSNIQKTYSVPDVDLATLLRKETKDLILNHYTKFYNVYHATNFTKNPDKYIRFTPQDVITIVDRSFDVR